MVRNAAATMRSPLRSMRPTISPTRPRSTASGLQMKRVRSLMRARRLLLRSRSPSSPLLRARCAPFGLLRSPPGSVGLVVDEGAPRRADDVEGAGHDDLRVRRCGLDRVLDGFVDGLDHVDD